MDKKRSWEADAVMEIRMKSGLSQKKFAEKYEIPFRTFQDWELGNRIPPTYVVEMLAKVADLENVQLTGWFFNEYRDSKGIGTNKMFRTKEEAIKEARDAWDHLSEADKDSYRKDDFAEFYVAEFPLEWDAEKLEYVPATSDYSPEWSAIEGR